MKVITIIFKTMQAQLLMIYFTDLSNLFITRINTKLSPEPLQLAERSLGNYLRHGQCKRFNRDTVFRTVRSVKARKSFPSARQTTTSPWAWSCSM